VLHDTLGISTGRILEKLGRFDSNGLSRAMRQARKRWPRWR
jgi:hypothetical protein